MNGKLYSNLCLEYYTVNFGGVIKLLSYLHVHLIVNVRSHKVLPLSSIVYIINAQ